MEGKIGRKKRRDNGEGKGEGIMGRKKGTG